MKVFVLFLCLVGVVFGYPYTRYQVQVSRFDCKSTVDLPYNDWVCSGPLKNLMTKYVNVKMTLYNEGNFLYKEVLYEQRMDLCKVQESMYLYLYDYQTIKTYLGASTSTLCPVVDKLPMNAIRFDRAVFPEKLTNGNYRLNIQVMDEKFVEYFNINMFFVLNTNQPPPGLLDGILGTTRPPMPLDYNRYDDDHHHYHHNMNDRYNG